MHELTFNQAMRTYTSTPAMTKADLVSGWELRELDEMPMGAYNGLGYIECSCQHKMYTEGDFARHYLIPDATYLNLGECPNGIKAPGITRNIKPVR